MNIRILRILITKSNLDAHDRGARFIAKALKDAGMEVVYTRFATPMEIVQTALQEDVDLIGISLLCGGYKYTASEVMKLLKERNMDMPVIIGGQVPDDEREKILQTGVSGVMPQDVTAAEVIDYINSLALKKNSLSRLEIVKQGKQKALHTDSGTALEW